MKVLTFHEALDGDIERVNLVHLLQVPHAPLAVPAHGRTLVAVFAQSHAGVLPVLLYVVGVTGAGCIADRAWQFFHAVKVLTLFCCWVVVQAFFSLSFVSMALENSIKS